MVKVSVIICTRNRLDDLKKSLPLVLRQNFKDYEIIVVDNMSDTNDIKNYVKRFRTKKLRYVRAFEKPNLCYARNIGIKNSKGEIVAFIDDDSLVGKNWLRSVVECFNNNNVGGAGGRVVIPKNSKLFESEYLRSKGFKRFFYEILALFLDYYGKPGSIKNSGQVIGFFDFDRHIEVDHVCGCNMFFRKNVLIKAGLFDESYENYPLREETDMCVRVKKLGYKIIFNPEAKVFHKLTKKGRVFSRMNFYYRNRHHIYFVFKNRLIKGFDGLLKFILQQFTDILFFLFYAIRENSPKILLNSVRGKIDGFKIAIKI